MGNEGLMCGRCAEFTSELVDPICAEWPELLVGHPIGMYHCPQYSAMLLAGVPHPKTCVPCRDKIAKGET